MLSVTPGRHGALGLKVLDDPGRPGRRVIDATPEAPQNPVGDHGAHCYLSQAVRENKEVVPVDESTWVLPSGVTVGR
ncbi:hypothetical protein Xph01_32070 [Micromonospora phaseoli]|nr:hypothetical protein Xph01_32070 [Micromonospora phaseoli]